MDALSTLTGGIRFNSKKNKQALNVLKENKPFNVSTSAASHFFGSNKELNKPVPEDEDEEDNDDTVKEDRRKLRKITNISGIDIPEPITSVSQLRKRYNIPNEIYSNIKTVMKKPTPVQSESWAALLDNRDVIACAPTGTGKTMAFGVPLVTAAYKNKNDLMDNECFALVVEPTRELAHQVGRELRKLTAELEDEIHVSVLTGEGRRPSEITRKSSRSARKRRLAKKKSKDQASKKVNDDDGSVDSSSESEAEPIKFNGIVVTTPLKIISAIDNKDIDLSKTRYLILDEADKLFERNFLLQTDKIIAACEGLENTDKRRSNLVKGLFSATMPSTVEEHGGAIMRGGDVGTIRIIVGHKEAATNLIEQELIFAGTEDHKLSTIRQVIASGGFTPPVLIFVQSIDRAKELVAELLVERILANSLHADKTEAEREQVMNDFRSGKLWCLVATDVMARGLDFPNVNLVINYDFPQSSASYIHRIGRTGRAGRKGHAITFFTKDDAPYLKTIVNVMRASGCDVPEWMTQLKNPSKNEKKLLKNKPVHRKSISRTNGASQIVERGPRAPKRRRIMADTSNQHKSKKLDLDE